MQIFHHCSLTSIRSEQSLALAIGMFDGIHLGHDAMLDSLIKMAHENSLNSAVWSFTSNHHKSQHNRIISEENRIQRLKNKKINFLHNVDFVPEISKLSAEEFLDIVLIKQLKVKVVLMGSNAQLGKDRHCKASEFKKLAAEKGIHVELFNLLTVENKVISSSSIRSAIMEGDFSKAKMFLGYPWFIEGNVIDGHKKGRAIGFPTANLLMDDIVVPPKGVYACSMSCEDLKIHDISAIVNIGQRPTLNDGDDIVVEVHIPNWSGDLYEKKIRISDLQFIRAEKKFESIDKLKYQIKLDISSLN